MNLKSKVVLTTASVLTASALLIASPALAHKNKPQSSPKPVASSVATTPTAAPTPPVFGDRHKDGKGRHVKGPKVAPVAITKTVTVDVPETGTYQLLVTEVKPADAPAAPAGAPARPDHSFTVAVTGTGSQTITLNLPHPGDYKVALINVVSSQSITATK